MTSAGRCLALAIALCAVPLMGDDAAPMAPADPDVYGIPLEESDYRHWAFQPIASPQPPAVEPAGWVRNPIDAFILKELHKHNLSPKPPAGPIAWLRRVTFDLIGLPPTPEEVAAFLDDPSPQARERVVDRLLADPGYGIRWGRHWLDVVRYADTNGYERDGNKPHAWRYRDYVIDSLNRDKPFDRFLTEHLAGDELDDSHAESMIATTFLRLGTWDDEPADPLVDRCDQLDDVVGTVSATFLGLTLRCARCHNHKFEPLSQIDYARMLAIFDPLKRPQDYRTDLDVAVGTRQELAVFNAAVERHESAIAALQDQLAALDVRVIDRFLATSKSSVSDEALAAHKMPLRVRTESQKKLVKETQAALDKELAPLRTSDEQSQREAFQAALKTLEKAAPSSLPRAYIWHEPPDPPVTQVLRRGNPLTPAGTIEPGFPAVMRDSHVPLLPPEPGRTSRRRLSLARWMASDTHPLTARVIVNRLWQGHFGNGLVPTENDFGVMGDRPTHPELLDWLASTLKQNGWRLKPIHRLICLSNTYRQRSAVEFDDPRLLLVLRGYLGRDRVLEIQDLPPLQSDSDRDLLRGFPYRRLDAEAVRDAVLAVSGQLNRQMGGPGVYPRIAREILEGQSRPGEGWPVSDEREAARRSAYVFVKRSLLLPEMELLDLADTTTSCEQRTVSTIPTQALTFLNGEFLNAQARHLAARLVREAGDDLLAQVRQAYLLALSRTPTIDELDAARAFIDRQRVLIAEEDRTAATPRDASRAALETWCVVLLNLNEFVYVD